MEFPRLVYKSSSVYQLVENETEFNAAINAGWFESVVCAKEVKKAEDIKSDNAPPTRKEIEEKCAELGIQVDGRNSDASLLKKIENKLNELDKKTAN